MRLVFDLGTLPWIHAEFTARDIEVAEDRVPKPFRAGGPALSKDVIEFSRAAQKYADRGNGVTIEMLWISGLWYRARLEERDGYLIREMTSPRDLKVLDKHFFPAQWGYAGQRRIKLGMLLGTPPPIPTKLPNRMELADVTGQALWNGEWRQCAALSQAFLPPSSAITSPGLGVLGIGSVEGAKKGEAAVATLICIPGKQPIMNHDLSLKYRDLPDNESNADTDAE